MLRKTSGLLFIVFLFAPFLGYYLHLQIQQQMIRSEVKQLILAGIDDEQLTKIILSKDQSEQLLSWKHSHEFEYRGALYDVVREESAGDRVIYWCWPDKKETALSVQIDLLIAKTLGQQQDRNKQQTFNQLFKIVYLGQSGHWQGDCPADAAANAVPTNCLLYKSLRYPPPFPPPQTG